MASQIAHIVYAEKYLEKYPLTNGDAEAFLAGCVFPDIRRIDKEIKRKDTHLFFQPIDLDFSGMTPFEAGWKFHLYCDMKREDILNQDNFYSLSRAGEEESLPGKFLEDRLVYDELKNWEKITAFFNNIPKFETKIKVLPETFELWYAILGKYLEKKPCIHSLRGFLVKTNFSPQKIERISFLVDDIAKNDKVINILAGVCRQIV